MERYTILSSLQENLYAENSPVVIAAGALLKDTQNGQILVLLKIKNITDPIIKAARVKISSFDTVGNLLGDDFGFDYLDLAVGRDMEFGQQVPIVLPDASTRSFSVQITEIIFEDNRIWYGEDRIWNPLEEQKSLAELLGSEQLAVQYRMEYGNFCRYAPKELEDIWFCSCGAINKAQEPACHSCHCELEQLKGYNIEDLEKKKSARIAANQEQAALREQKRKKNIKLFSVFAAIFAVCFVGVFVMNSHITNKIEAVEEALDWYVWWSEKPEQIVDGGGYTGSVWLFYDGNIVVGENVEGVGVGEPDYGTYEVKNNTISITWEKPYCQREEKLYYTYKDNTLQLYFDKAKEHDMFYVGPYSDFVE